MKWVFHCFSVIIKYFDWLVFVFVSQVNLIISSGSSIHAWALLTEFLAQVHCSDLPSTLE